MPSATRKRRVRIDRRTRPARAEGRDGREELLEAALQVFAERGYRDSSVDEIAERAGYSKGALYWHFASKDELFFALLEERIDRPWRETIELLGSAAPGQDMAPEASRRFAEMLGGQRELLLINHEYWSQAVRDPELRARYATRQANLRRALGKAIAARLEHLGAPPLDAPAEELATVFMSLASGLAQEKLVEPATVPDDLLGNTFALIYAGHVARAQRQKLPDVEPGS
jgi:AcrR family transcriptional regulator